MKTSTTPAALDRAATIALGTALLASLKSDSLGYWGSAFLDVRRVCETSPHRDVAARLASAALRVLPAKDQAGASEQLGSSLSCYAAFRRMMQAA